MSSRNMCLLPRATLHSDSKQERAWVTFGCKAVCYKILWSYYTVCSNSADWRWWGGSLPEEVGGQNYTSICGLSLAEAAETMEEAKQQQVAALLHAGLPITADCWNLGVR